MKESQIDNLIEKYTKGVSTIADERLLKDYFNRDDIPAKYSSYKLLFSGLNELSDTEKNQSLHEKILSSIHEIENSKSKRSHTLIYSIVSVAAAALIAIIMLFDWSGSSWNETYDNPEVAYSEAQKTILYVAGKYNMGMQKLEYLSLVNESIEPLNKSFSVINKGVATFEKTIDNKNLNLKK